MRDVARWMLIVWPEDLRGKRTLVSCVSRDAADDALGRGAIIVAVEREDWCTPTGHPAQQSGWTRSPVRQPKRKETIGEQETD